MSDDNVRKLAHHVFTDAPEGDVRLIMGRVMICLGSVYGDMRSANASLRNACAEAARVEAYNHHKEGLDISNALLEKYTDLADDVIHFMRAFCIEAGLSEEGFDEVLQVVNEVAEKLYGCPKCT